MNNDVYLLFILTVLLFAAAVLKMKLAKVKNEHLGIGWKIQRFIFPGMLLLVLILFMLNIADLVVPVIFLGIGEELICWFVRKKSKR